MYLGGRLFVGIILWYLEKGKVVEQRQVKRGVRCSVVSSLDHPPREEVRLSILSCS